MRTGDHDAGGAEVGDRGAQARAVQAFAQQQAFAAPAVAGVGVEEFLVRFRGLEVGQRFGFHLQALDAGATTLDEIVDAFEQVEETLRAGIDHAGLHQHRQLLRRIGERASRLFERGLEPAPRGLGVALRLERAGEGVDHAEDGAFARFRHGLARRACASLHRAGQDGRRHGDAVAQILGHAGEELRQDRAGIAAGAVDGVLAEHAHQCAGAGRAPAQRAGQDAAKGEGEVAAGVAVGHREDIDFIEDVAVRNHPPGAGNERAAQRGTPDEESGPVEGECVHRPECRGPGRSGETGVARAACCDAAGTCRAAADPIDSAMQPFARPRHQTRHTPNRASAAMTRFLLASCLLLFASTAFAKSPASTDDPADGSAKPGKAATSTNQYGDPATPAVPTTPPARSSTPLPTRGGAPRWHSLLPGMIR